MKCFNCNKEINNEKFCDIKCYQEFRKQLYDEKYTKQCLVCGNYFRCKSTAPKTKTCGKICLSKLLSQRTWSKVTNKKRSNTLTKYCNSLIRIGILHTKDEKRRIKESCKGINKKD